MGFAADAWLIPMLDLAPLFITFGTRFSVALRAAQKPQYDLLANAVAALTGILTGIIFIKLWGIGGAGASTVLGFAAYAYVFFLSYRRWSKELRSVDHA